MIKGYIIDMDGTLLDSMNIWETAAITLLKNRGIIVSDDLKRILAPLSIKDAINYLKNKYCFNETVSEIQKQLFDLIEYQYLNEVSLKTGVREFINKCTILNKKMCLLTANKRNLTIKILNKHKLISYFDQIITCDDTNLTKQDSDIYIYAMKKLNLNINECIVIEDALHAINTAKKAGFIVWGVADRSNLNDWIKIKSICDLAFKNMKFMEVL